MKHRYLLLHSLGQGAHGQAFLCRVIRENEISRVITDESPHTIKSTPRCSHEADDLACSELEKKSSLEVHVDNDDMETKDEQPKPRLSASSVTSIDKYSAFSSTTIFNKEQNQIDDVNNFSQSPYSCSCHDLHASYSLFVPHIPEIGCEVASDVAMNVHRQDIKPKTSEFAGVAPVFSQLSNFSSLSLSTASQPSAVALSSLLTSPFEHLHAPNCRKTTRGEKGDATVTVIPWNSFISLKNPSVLPSSSGSAVNEINTEVERSSTSSTDASQPIPDSADCLEALVASARRLHVELVVVKVISLQPPRQDQCSAAVAGNLVDNNANANTDTNGPANPVSLKVSRETPMKSTKAMTLEDDLTQVVLLHTEVSSKTRSDFTNEGKSTLDVILREVNAFELCGSSQNRGIVSYKHSFLIQHEKKVEDTSVSSPKIQPYYAFTSKQVVPSVAPRSAHLALPRDCLVIAMEYCDGGD